MESRGKKILMGCGLGCLSVVILAIAACTGFTMWLNSPGELLEPVLLIGGDTTGYASWTLRLEDPGTEEFVRAFFDTLQDGSRRERTGLPPVLDNWLAAIQKKQTEKDMQEIFPLVAAWTLRPGAAPGERLHLYSLSLERIGNRLVLVDWIFSLVFPRADGIEVVAHENEKIYRARIDRNNSSFAFFIRGNDLFITSDMRTATLAVDRLVGGGDLEPARYELRELFEVVPDNEPLRAAIMNQEGTLKRVWCELAGESDAAAVRWDGVTGLAVSGRFVDRETFQAVLEFKCLDSTFAASNADNVTDMLRSVLDDTEFDFDLATSVHGEWIRIDLTGRNMITRLRNLIEESGGRIRVRGRS
jgi:hypothetical protein